MIAPDFEPSQETESHQEMNGVLANCSLTSCGQEAARRGQAVQSG